MQGSGLGERFPLFPMTAADDPLQVRWRSPPTILDW
jgi:hypothetical protein